MRSSIEGEILELKRHDNGGGDGVARDILWAFTGRDMYRMFVVERGWTSEEYEKLLARLLLTTLMDGAK